MSARAGDAFDQHDWTEVHRILSVADEATLGATDHERLAVAAYLLGDDATSRRAWETAHTSYRREDHHADAARCAVWLAITMLLRGDVAHGGGWLARTERIIEEEQLDCAAGGYMLVPAFLQALSSGDLASATQLAGAIRAAGQRFDDPDLLALGTLGQGQVALAAGQVADGLALLDETMVGLRADDASPITTGIVYCAVIESCMAAHDLGRAAEWTDTLTDWCDAQPGLVAFRGQCAVHRSQILSLRGEWGRALIEARHAEHLLADPPHPALGLACYQEAELHRLSGDHEAAEAAYRRASQHGFTPVPGLALLHLARAHLDEAASMIANAVDSADPSTRPLVLAASVDILRARGDLHGAREAADDLCAIAADRDTALLHALAGHALGTVLLAEGAPSDALIALRVASRCWVELGAPYEGARTRTATGLAHAALGDQVTADLELDAARDVFSALGATTDIARVDVLRGGTNDRSDDGLTEREREVLRAVADGLTNRQIADDLTISEHTVARHLQNIFTKIGVRSRAAATAYAYEHQLV